MKRILVPTDFSPTAEKAFRLSLDIAAKAGGTVILIHVYTPVQSTFIDTEQKRKEYNFQTEKNILQRMLQLKKRVAGDFVNVTVSAIVGHAPIIDNLLLFAAQNRISLLVMGTQGASGLKRVLVGSVAAHLIEKSNFPVLLVPEKYDEKPLVQIVFATCYQNADLQALALVNALAKLYHASLTVLHLLNIYSAESEKKKEQMDFQVYAVSIQEALHEPNLEFKLMETASVSDTMAALEKEYPYDMMVMVRGRKSLLEKLILKSFTKNMAYITQRPLLIVPETVS